MNPLLALWASIILGSIGQVFLRLAARNNAHSSAARGLFNSLRSPWIMAYLACFFLAMVFWLIVLKTTPISYAFPLLSAGFVFVALLSRLVLDERISKRRWISIAVISLGVVLIAKY